MDSEIVKTLELMCDKENPQDKKLLLLAELVETKCEALRSNQDELKSSLDNTNDKLDKLTMLLEKYQNDTNKCPVYKNRATFEKVSFIIRNPKLSMFMALGILALLGGFFESWFTNLIKLLFGV